VRADVCKTRIGREQILIAAPSPTLHPRVAMKLISSKSGRIRTTPAAATGAHAVGTAALGSIAMGAIAVGALAIGALSIGRLFIGRVRIQRLVIDELVVRRIHVTEQLTPPPVSGADVDGGESKPAT